MTVPALLHSYHLILCSFHHQMFLNYNFVLMKGMIIRTCKQPKVLMLRSRSMAVLMLRSRSMAVELKNTAC